jgi:hypothetical protein
MLSKRAGRYKPDDKPESARSKGGLLGEHGMSSTYFHGRVKVLF